MALMQSVESSTGLIIENAYIKIDEYSCSKDNIVNARLKAYISQDAAKDNKSPIEGSEDFVTMLADYSENAHNVKKQLYEFAKKKEKYKNAIDV